MTKFLISCLCFLFLLIANSNAQRDTSQIKSIEETFEIEEHQAEFPGGQAEFYKFFKRQY